MTSKKNTHSRLPGLLPAADLLSCSARCKALLMLIFFCSSSYFCNGSDLRSCAGKTCFSWVIPDQCRQAVTATQQGKVLRRSEMEDLKREQQQVFSLSLAGARSPGLSNWRCWACMQWPV